ncbi:hypothetical protein B0G57_109226 [Trinickia symbiotica]|nr:hypothetical protein B0G57_109226 [Trinickia symbiotica]
MMSPVGAALRRSARERLAGWIASANSLRMI